jgi:hypothetical protein
VNYPFHLFFLLPLCFLFRPGSFPVIAGCFDLVKAVHGLQHIRERPYPFRPLKEKKKKKNSQTPKLFLISLASACSPHPSLPHYRPERRRKSVAAVACVGSAAGLRQPRAMVAGGLEL